MSGRTRPSPVKGEMRQPADHSVLWLLAAASIALVVFSSGCRGGGTANSSATPASTPSSSWQQAEYDKLARLRGGETLDYVRALLGVPMFAGASSDGRFTQSIFQGREYWVQTVSDAGGTVQLLAVTSCAADFHPRFDGLASASPDRPIVILNTTRLDQTGIEPQRVHYSQSRATGNSYFYDEYSLGNPGNYKTYFIGIDDACPYAFPAAVTDSLITSADYTDRPYDAADGTVTALRAAAVANTYAETGPFADLAVQKAFQIGADRILTRTAPPFPGG